MSREDHGRVDGLTDGLVLLHLDFARRKRHRAECVADETVGQLHQLDAIARCPRRDCNCCCAPARSWNGEGEQQGVATAMCREPAQPWGRTNPPGSLPGWGSRGLLHGGANTHRHHDVHSDVHSTLWLASRLSELEAALTIQGKLSQIAPGNPLQSTVVIAQASPAARRQGSSVGLVRSCTDSSGESGLCGGVGSTTR